MRVRVQSNSTILFTKISPTEAMEEVIVEILVKRNKQNRSGMSVLAAMLD
jgi:hypothetical protein